MKIFMHNLPENRVLFLCGNGRAGTASEKRNKISAWNQIYTTKKAQDELPSSVFCCEDERVGRRCWIQFINAPLFPPSLGPCLIQYIRMYAVQHGWMGAHGRLSLFLTKCAVSRKSFGVSQSPTGARNNGQGCFLTAAKRKATPFSWKVIN